MKEKINRLEKGIFDYQLPELLLSEEILYLTVETGKAFHGSFRVYNSMGDRMKGRVYSGSRILTIDEAEFLDSVAVISYHVNTDYLDAGNRLTGKIKIISEYGEKYLPFEINVESPSCETSLGTVKDMFQFANLAKASQEEARELFFSTGFTKMLRFHNKDYAISYETLVKSRNKEQAMEEFLIAVHKKVRLNFTVNRLKLSYETSTYDLVDKLIITKDTWGYGRLYVRSEAVFIQPSETVIDAENFENNQFELGLVIKAERMKPGWHFGKLIIEDVYQSTEINVVCRCLKSRESREWQKKKRSLLVCLTENYINFRTSQCVVGKYTAEAEKYNAELRRLQKDNVLDELYYIHLLQIAGKEVQAATLFADIKISRDENTSEEYAAYLYIKTLLKRQEANISMVCSEIRELYARNSHWLIFWILLYVDERYEADSRRKYEDIKAFVQHGCKNPVIYFEAAVLIKEEPSLMKELGFFEQQILNFGLKKKMFPKEVSITLSYLAMREKNFKPLVFDIVKRFYFQFKTKDILPALVSMLIRGHRTEVKYYEWYELGIKEQLKLAELPEYYLIASQALNVPVPVSSIYTYFQSYLQIEAKKRAYLYATLLKNPEIGGQYYAAYEHEILSFAKEQVLKKNVSRDLADIYAAVLTKQRIDTDLAAALPDIIFRHEIKCPNKKMNKVLVVHKEAAEEEIKPLIDGRALVDIYTEDAEIVLIDEAGGYYKVTVGYTLERLMDSKTYADICYQLGIYDRRVVLYLVERLKDYHDSSYNVIELKEKAAKLPGLRGEYQRNHIMDLIYYYYENFEGELLEKYLLQIDLKLVPRGERLRFMEFMIIRDLYNIVLKAMAEFGYEGMDIKRLLKLASRLIFMGNNSLEKVDIILELCYYVFSAGKYEEGILKYLADYYSGTTEEMYEIWKTAGQFEIDRINLEERLLECMVFTENNVNDSYDVFLSYYQGGGLDHSLIRAILSYYAYKYLVRDRVIKEELFEVMKKEVGHEENEVCILALLKYFSFKDKLTEGEILFADYRLHQMEQKEILLPFFKSFAGRVKKSQFMPDKYYVEYRTDPKYTVKLHYVFDFDHDYKTLEMKNMCYGIFIQEFILFYGESLHYYITEEYGGTENITESRAVRLSEEGNGIEDTKYYKLNLMFMAKAFGDETTVLKIMEDYIRMEHDINKLFYPI